MNQINGYCQIELPDRISLDALNTAGVRLTSAEVKPLIKALNLDQVLVGDDYSSYINAWLNKPVIVKAYMPTEEEGREVKSIFHAALVSAMLTSDNLYIQFAYEYSGDLKLIKISIYADGGEPGKPMDWSVQVSARKITTTDIA